MLKNIFMFWALALVSATVAKDVKNEGKIYLKDASSVPAMPNIAYATRGYNILAGNPLATGLEADPGFDGTIFDIVYDGAVTPDFKFQVPEGFSIFDKNICNIDFLAKRYANEKTYQDELKLAVAAEYKDFKAAFTASVEFSKLSQSMITDEHVYVKTESTCGVYEVIIDQYATPPLSEGFINAVRTLENLEDDDAYQKFINVYGTHFLSSTHVGAKYVEQVELSKEGKEELERSGIDIAATADIATKFHLGIDVGSSTEDLEKFESATISRTIIAYGSKPPASGKPIDWTNSVFEDPLPISYSLLPIDTIFTEAYMKDYGIDFESIRPKLKTYVDSYCDLHQTELGINSCDGPRGGCSGGHDCHQNAHCEDVVIETTTSYECICNDGYEGNGFQCSGWNIQETVMPDNYDGLHSRGNPDYGWGDWNKVDLCPKGTYAYGFVNKADMGDFWSFARDDSALNAIKLYCQSYDKEKRGEATSGVGKWGDWNGYKTCLNPDSFLDGFRFRAEPFSVHIDNIFGTNFDMRCDNEEVLSGTGPGWGRWGTWTGCQADKKICGIQTKVMKETFGMDNVALSDVKIICCGI